MLQPVRPLQGADLVKLRKLTNGRGWRGALPAALPDKLLLELANDFRQVELAAAGEGGDDRRLNAPIFAVLNLLSQHPGRTGPLDAELTISEDSLTRGLQAYQWAVEREIVTRILGCGATRDSASLLKIFGNLDA